MWTKINKYESKRAGLIFLHGCLYKKELEEVLNTGVLCVRS